MEIVWKILAIGSAGFIGAVTRWGLALWLNTEKMYWGTLAINVSGAFILGWLMTIATAKGRAPLPPTLVLAIGTGFVGAYTTFSTLMFETNKQLEEGSNWLGFGYLVGSVVLGMAAVKAGVMLAR